MKFRSWRTEGAGSVTGLFALVKPPENNASQTKGNACNIKHLRVFVFGSTWFNHGFALLNNRLVREMPCGMPTASAILNLPLTNKLGH